MSRVEDYSWSADVKEEQVDSQTAEEVVELFCLLLMLVELLSSSQHPAGSRLRFAQRAT
jgi:hypothetical protein